jgi:hypothetical protein
MMIVLLAALWTLNIHFTGLGTWIIPITSKTTGRWTMNPFKARQWCPDFRHPRAWGCECPTECYWIDLANTEVQEKGSKGVVDGRYTGN